MSDKLKLMILKFDLKIFGGIYDKAKTAQLKLDKDGSNKFLSAYMEEYRKHLEKVRKMAAKLEAQLSPIAIVAEEEEIEPPKYQYKKMSIVFYDREKDAYYWDEYGHNLVEGAPESIGRLSDDGKHIIGYGDVDYEIRPVRRVLAASDSLIPPTPTETSYDVIKKELTVAKAETRFIPRLSTVWYNATASSLIPFKGSAVFDDIFSLEVTRIKCSNKTLLLGMQDLISKRLDIDYQTEIYGHGIVLATSDIVPTLIDKIRYRYNGDSTLKDIAESLNIDSLSRLSDDTLFQILRYIGPAKTEELLTRIPTDNNLLYIYLYDRIRRLRNIWLVGYAKGMSDAFRGHKLELIQQLLSVQDIRTVLDHIDDIIEFYPTYVEEDKDMSFVDDLKSIDNLLSVPTNDSGSYVL